MSYQKEEIQNRLSEPSAQKVRTGPSYIKLSYIFSLLMLVLGIGLAEYRNSMIQADPLRVFSEGLEDVRSYDNFSEKTTVEDNRVTIEMSSFSTDPDVIEQRRANISTSIAQTAVPIILIFLSVVVAVVTSIIAIVKVLFFRRKHAA